MKLFLLKLIRAFHLISEQRYASFRDYLVVESSPLFDAEWYLRQYPDVRAKKKDPVWHYCRYGWKEGRLPGAIVRRDVLAKNPKFLFAQRDVFQYYQELCKTVVVTADGASFPVGAVSVDRDWEIKPFRTGRTAVYAVFTADGKIPDTTLYYLKGLQQVVDNIVLVADNPILPDEPDKLAGLVCHCEFDRHGEYDFGSYKRGWLYVMRHPRLKKSKQLVFCNDSCYAPVTPFAPVFAKMEKRDLDFWGMCSNTDIQYHLQSYFWVMKHEVFVSKAFHQAFASIGRQPSVREVVLNYEVPFTKKMSEAGFKVGALVDFDMAPTELPRILRNNPTSAPIYCMEHGSPLVKVKAIRKLDTNNDGILNTLRYLKGRNQELAEMLEKFRPDYGKVSFSIVMPTYNRKDCICTAIDAVLGQSYQKFELIIADDGSTDGTEALIRSAYADEVKSGKIKYLKAANAGVCKARNRGLANASNDWIAYADSDNQMVPNFLELVAEAIRKCPDRKAFYGQFKTTKKGVKVGRPFDFKKLLEANFIDLGTYVHKKSLVRDLGGFDESMTRLVDWDLIARYSAKFPPAYIAQVVLLYNDIDRNDRITQKANYIWNLNHLRAKHGKSEIVTTVITAYNHKPYIKRAIESAMAQKGPFVHEILLSDDGSTDGTRAVIKEFAAKYPSQIRDISSDVNQGISANMKRCFAEASGKYVAVLEGDDIWTWDSKLRRQMEFLESNTDCPMVFSRINVCNDETGRKFLLDRQEGLKSKLTGADFIKDPYQNLIANFSSCMFRADVMKTLPDVIYTERFNEISCAFCLERLGPIGFIPIAMSNYYIHAGSTWSTAEKEKKQRSSIRCREVALKLCAEQYKLQLQSIIDNLRKGLPAGANEMRKGGL